MPASSLLKLRCLKRGCSFTSLAPAPRHPRRSRGSLHRSCNTEEISSVGWRVLQAGAALRSARVLQYDSRNSTGLPGSWE